MTKETQWATQNGPSGMGHPEWVTQNRPPRTGHPEWATQNGLPRIGHPAPRQQEPLTISVAGFIVIKALLLMLHQCCIKRAISSKMVQKIEIIYQLTLFLCLWIDQPCSYGFKFYIIIGCLLANYYVCLQCNSLLTKFIILCPCLVTSTCK